MQFKKKKKKKKKKKSVHSCLFIVALNVFGPEQ